MSKVEFEKLLGFEVEEEIYKTIKYVMAWHPAFTTDPKSAPQKAINIIKNCGFDVLYQMVETAEYMESLNAERENIMDMLASIDRRTDQVMHGNLSEERCRAEVSWMYSISRSDEEWNYFVDGLEKKHGKRMTDNVVKDLGLPSAGSQDGTAQAMPGNAAVR